MKKHDIIINKHAPTTLESEQEKAVFASLSANLSTVPQAQAKVAALQAHLTKRIQASIAKHAGIHTVRSRDGIWQNLVSGIRYKLLWKSPIGNSVLIEFTPGASLPVHRHSHQEEGIVLSGSMQVDDLTLQKFDYHVSPEGSHHGKIWSKEGGTAFLRGSSVGQTMPMLKEVLGGLMPKNHRFSTSIMAGDSEWVEVQNGVFKKIMWTDGKAASWFIRLDPDTKIEDFAYTEHEECMMLSGEIFFGDILLQAGDYQLVPQGTEHHDIYSDTGALFYARGAVH